MQIPTDGIQVNPGRREVDNDHVFQLAASIKELGLLNPITIDQDHTLIAGLHRLEAVKSLGWTEVECTISSLDGLQAELAEIDENIIRNGFSTLEHGEMLLRRKEIYEMLHPETKNGVAQAVAMNKAVGNNVTAKSAVTSKSFVEDTAKKLGVAPRTIRQQIQTAKNLTPETKRILKESDKKFTQKSTLKLSRLEPVQQQEAATLLVAKEIKSVEEYTATKTPKAELPRDAPELPATPPKDIPPYTLSTEHCATLKEVVAELKDTDKDFSCTPDSFLAEFTAFVRKYLREIQWYSSPYIEEVFPCLTTEHFDYLRQQMDSIGTVNQTLLNQIERNMKS